MHVRVWNFIIFTENNNQNVSFPYIFLKWGDPVRKFQFY